MAVASSIGRGADGADILRARGFEGWAMAMVGSTAYWASEEVVDGVAKRAERRGWPLVYAMVKVSSQ